MSGEYFKKLKEVTHSINESKVDVEISIQDKIKSILKKHNIEVYHVSCDKTPLLENNEFLTTAPNKKIYFLHDFKIKISDKLLIESEIKKLSGINYVSFGDYYIMVDCK
jgi:hypothetical protein